MVLDCLAAGSTVEEILAEYPPLTVAGVRAAAAYGALLARDELSPIGAVKVELDENVPASAAVLFADAGIDADTVTDEGLSGACDPDVPAAAAASGRLLITLDRGLGDVPLPAGPPRRHRRAPLARPVRCRDSCSVGPSRSRPMT